MKKFLIGLLFSCVIFIAVYLIIIMMSMTMSEFRSLN